MSRSVRPPLRKSHQGAGTAASHVEPDRLSAGSQSRMRQRHAQRFGHHLRGGGGSQELTAASGRRASLAAEFGGVFQGEFPLSITGTDRLDFSGVFARRGRQRNAAGNQHRGKIGRAGQRHHHGRQPLVAGGDSQHAAPRRQRSDQAAEQNGGIVSIRQAVEHAHRALGAAIARIAAISGERHAASLFNNACCSSARAAPPPNGPSGSPTPPACRPRPAGRLAC